jgi:hypothetical protein
MASLARDQIKREPAKKQAIAAPAGEILREYSAAS